MIVEFWLRIEQNKTKHKKQREIDNDKDSHGDSIAGKKKLIIDTPW